MQSTQRPVMSTQLVRSDIGTFGIQISCTNIIVKEKKT